MPVALCDNLLFLHNISKLTGGVKAVNAPDNRTDGTKKVVRLPSISLTGSSLPKQLPLFERRIGVHLSCGVYCNKLFLFIIYCSEHK
jgi:hypothetical protein